MKTFNHLPPIPGKYCACTKPAVRQDSTKQYVCARCSNLECRDGIEDTRERVCGVEHTKRKERQRLKMRELRAERRELV